MLNLTQRLILGCVVIAALGVALVAATHRALVAAGEMRLAIALLVSLILVEVATVMNNGDVRSHLIASSSLIASAAVISPFFSRSRTSERDGEGFVSMNCSNPEMRFNRALMVG